MSETRILNRSAMRDNESPFLMVYLNARTVLVGPVVVDETLTCWALGALFVQTMSFCPMRSVSIGAIPFHLASAAVVTP